MIYNGSLIYLNFSCKSPLVKTAVKLSQLTFSDDIAIKFRYLFFKIFLGKDDIKGLGYAKTLLENPRLAAGISNLLGTPIEKGFEHLPSTWKDVVQRTPKNHLKNFMARNRSSRNMRS